MCTLVFFGQTRFHFVVVIGRFICREKQLGCESYGYALEEVNRLPRFALLALCGHPCRKVVSIMAGDLRSGQTVTMGRLGNARILRIGDFISPRNPESEEGTFDTTRCICCGLVLAFRLVVRVTAATEVVSHSKLVHCFAGQRVRSDSHLCIYGPS